MMKLLRFSSKDVLLLKLEKVQKVFQENLEGHHKLLLTLDTLKNFKKRISSGGSEIDVIPQLPTTSSPTLDLKGVTGRQQMLEKLKQSAKQNPVHHRGSPALPHPPESERLPHPVGEEIR